VRAFVMNTKSEIVEAIDDYNRDPANFGKVTRRG
jgi:redox-sensitive bicupin YhaK (pirin superfamily)